MQVVHNRLVHWRTTICKTLTFNTKDTSIWCKISSTTPMWTPCTWFLLDLTCPPLTLYTDLPQLSLQVEVVQTLLVMKSKCQSFLKLVKILLALKLRMLQQLLAMTCSICLSIPCQLIRPKAQSLRQWDNQIISVEIQYSNRTIFHCTKLRSPNLEKTPWLLELLNSTDLFKLRTWWMSKSFKVLVESSIPSSLSNQLWSNMN